MSALMVIRRASEMGRELSASVGPDAALGLDVSEEERQMLLLALAHTSLGRPGWADALRRLARKFEIARFGAPPPDEGDHYTPMFEAFRETGNSAIVCAKTAIEATIKALPRCAQCDLPADCVRFESTKDRPVDVCMRHAAGGVGYSERKWVGQLFAAQKALENAHLR